MLLSAQLIVNFCTINMFDFENQWKIRAGDPNTLYFQLTDLDQDKLRYLAGIGSSNQPYSVTVTFPSIDCTKKIVSTATQVSAADSSIWSVNLLSTQIPGSGNVLFTVYEGTSVRNFSVKNALAVEYPGQDGCC